MEKNQLSLEIDQQQYLVKVDIKGRSSWKAHQKQRNIHSRSAAQKTNPLQILVAFLGCLCFSTSAVLRVHQGDNVNFSNMIVTLSLLGTSIVYFAQKMIRQKVNGQVFLYPWQYTQSLGFNIQSQPKSDKAMLAFLFIGGILEFVGNEFLVIGFKNIQLANMNNGIVQSISASAVVVIIFGSFFFFNEKVTPMQLLGITLLISAVCIVSIFRESPQSQSQSYDPQVQQDAGYHSLIAIAATIFASQCFGIQILIFKHIIKKPVNPSDCGFAFLFFCGICGIMSLIYEIIFDREQFSKETLPQYFLTYLVGTATSLGIVLSNVAAGLGLAGISFSIINFSAIVVSLFNFLAYGQDLNSLQLIGIALAVVGAIIVSIADQIKCDKRK